MTKCRKFICYVSVSTYGASISGIAAVYTVGISYYCIIVVTICRNHSLCYENLATYVTMASLGKTGCSAGRCYCLINHYGVTLCRNGYVLSRKLCITYGTVYYVIVRASVYTVRIYVVLYNDVT